MKDRVIRSARELGLDVHVRALGAPRRTVDEAAAAVGCEAARIAMTTLFVADGEPVLAVASGAGRIDHDRLCEAFDCAEIRQATPEEVRAATGYPAGGVSPVGCGVPVVFDAELLRHDSIYAAAGDDSSLLEVDPRELARSIGARVLTVA